jgi:hypothetical protein
MPSIVNYNLKQTQGKIMEMIALNYWGVLAGAVAAFVVGAVWYGVLGKQWQEGLEKKIEGAGASPIQMIVSGITALVGITGIAYIYGLSNGAGIMDGLTAGLFVTIFFTMMPITNNYSWAGRKFKLTLIDTGHYIVSFAIGGAVYGFVTSL